MRTSSEGDDSTSQPLPTHSNASERTLAAGRAVAQHFIRSTIRNEVEMGASYPNRRLVSMLGDFPFFQTGEMRKVSKNSNLGNGK